MHISGIDKTSVPWGTDLFVTSGNGGVTYFHRCAIGWGDFRCCGVRKVALVYIYIIHIYTPGSNIYTKIIFFWASSAIWRKFCLLNYVYIYIYTHIYIYTGFGPVFGIILACKYPCDLWYLQTQADYHAPNTLHGGKGWKRKRKEGSDYTVCTISSRLLYFSLGVVGVIAFKVFYKKRWRINR